MTNKRDIWVAIGISLLCFVLNFGLFIYFYNQLATPFITEEQRVSNAEYIMSLTVGGFAVAAIIIGFFVIYFLNKSKFGRLG
ncbi:hypothetical protein [Methylobacter sp.]|jgi:uncharacterized membrane protein|uniref:hypothetical protein n=1 Tax=Methylobacter sp. TaxID=2051955 RepID=UPI003DA69B9C